MTEEVFTLLKENYESYGFYPFGNEIVCCKLKTLEKYFLDHEGCSCKGFRSHGKCKHVGMMNGAWTPVEGTPDWYANEFEGILPKVSLPETFNTVFVVDPLPFKYKVLCLTVKYEKYSMGVTIFDPEFDKFEFERILCLKNQK
jgi:hypothetical protein